MKDKLRIGVIGAGRWAGMAHIPGWKRSPLVDLVVICDIDREKAASRAKEFDVPGVETDYQKVLSSGDIDVVDIVTSGDNHEPLTFAALEAGKHVLVEKPVCHDYKDVWRAHALATSKKLKTKVGLTFRYAPAMQYMYDLIDDGDIYIGEYANGAICSMQSSYVTVGNYPGIEARLYGSKGALICRLVEEFGECQVLRSATPEAVEFVEVEVPASYFPVGYKKGESWRSLFYANLVHNFAKEITEGGEANQGNFAQSARVQEIINAVERSHRERRWVDLPLDPGVGD